MKYLPILSNGIARINVGLTSCDNKNMVELPFLIDTGATRTCINKFILIKKLGYTEDWLNKKQNNTSQKQMARYGKRRKP